MPAWHSANCLLCCLMHDSRIWLNRMWHSRHECSTYWRNTSTNKSIGREQTTLRRSYMSLIKLLARVLHNRRELCRVGLCFKLAVNKRADRFVLLHSDRKNIGPYRQSFILFYVFKHSDSQKLFENFHFNEDEIEKRKTFHRCRKRIKSKQFHLLSTEHKIASDSTRRTLNVSNRFLINPKGTRIWVNKNVCFRLFSLTFTPEKSIER